MPKKVRVLRSEDLRVVVVLVVARDVHRVQAIILYFEEVWRHELRML